MNFKSGMKVELISTMGDDEMICNAARVSTGKNLQAFDPEKNAGLLKYLMESHHTSPFEHAVATFYIHVPIFVAREWMRHRTQSYNELSGRYRELFAEFYVPAAERPMIQTGKPGAYTFELGTQHAEVCSALKRNAEAAWREYQGLLQQGVAREVARMVLPVNIYTDFYATANLRNWLAFLTLRTHESAMLEIRQASATVEQELKTRFPKTLELWDSLGRSF